MTLMILLALAAMLFVNRDVRIPASNLFAVAVILMFALTFIGTLNVYTDVSGLSPEEAARVVFIRTLASTLSYILRPCVILTELLIIRHGKKYRLICVIPAVINALIYSTALFGSDIAFHIDSSNHWGGGGPLRFSVYIVQLLYLLLLLYNSVIAFCTGDRKKCVMLIIIFVQAVLVSILEYNNITDYTDPITALCILEYYIYLSTVYRQELNTKLNESLHKIKEAGIRYKDLTKEVMEALANAIDAKDTYTNGHSLCVAEYSRNIAEFSGKPEDDCK